MRDRILFNNICPLLESGEQQLLNDCFREELQKSNRLEIVVGFCSYESLKELEKLVLQMNIKRVCLILGMYYFNGFTKLLHELVVEINEKWRRTGIGEMRLVHSWKYHGKIYCFFKNNQIFSIILGSPNLSFLTAKQTNEKAQKEIALLTKEPIVLKKFPRYLQYLKSKKVSENIASLEKYKLFVKEHPQMKKKRSTSKCYILKS